jgi:hypothetical protein
VYCVERAARGTVSVEGVAGEDASATGVDFWGNRKHEIGWLLAKLLVLEESGG